MWGFFFSNFDSIPVKVYELSPNWKVGITILFHSLLFLVITIPFLNKILIPQTKRSLRHQSYRVPAHSDKLFCMISSLIAVYHVGNSQRTPLDRVRIEGPAHKLF
jgi:hypothetical protein